MRCELIECEECEALVTEEDIRITCDNVKLCKDCYYDEEPEEKQ